MAIGTYAELKTSVANWLDRTDLTSRIPEFIAVAESEIARKVRSRWNEKRITASISTEYFDLPTTFIRMRNFQLNTDPIQHLNYESPEQIDLLYPNSTVGQPKAYSIHGKEFQVKPVPDTTYTAEMTYWYRLTAFSADADTNDLLTNFPDVYLWGSLLAAQTFLIDDPRIGLWDSLFKGAVKELNDMDKAGRFSGTSLYSKPRNVPE